MHPRPTSTKLIPATLAAVALLCGATPAAASDHTPPRITSAKTRDTNADGKVDTIRVGFSEKVGLLPGKGSLKIAVAGYSVKSVSLAAPAKKLATPKRCYAGRSIRKVSKKLRVAVAEKSAPDTAATPLLTYTRTRKRGDKVVDASCNEAYAGLYRNTRDGAGPILTAATTADQDANGKLDTVKASFSEPVSYAGSSGGAANVAVAGMTVSGIQAATAAANLHVSLAEAAAPNTGNRPAVTYDPAAGGLPVTDAAGNHVKVPLTVASTDGAAPVLLGAVTADLGGAAGAIDRINLSYSEPVAHTADSDGSYPLSVNGYAITSVGAGSGTNVPINLTEGAPDTGDKPTIGYIAGPSGAIVDAAGNQPRTGTFSATADGAAPVLVSAHTADADADGKIDALKVVFSEPLTYAGQNGGLYPFSIAGYSVTFTNPTSGATLTVNLAEGAGLDTSARPPLVYLPGTGVTILDPVNLEAPAKTITQVADGAGPAIVGATTADSNGNGQLDTIHLTFSETVSHADQTVGPFPIRVAGHNITEVGSPTGIGSDNIDLTLDQSGYDTGETPQVSYTGDGGVPITDAATPSNPPPAGGVNPTDGAPPVLVSGQTADSGPVDGRIDTAHIVWSEPVSHAGDSDGSYPLSVSSPAYSIAPAGIPGVSGQSGLDLPLVEHASADRDKSPAVAYNAAGPDAPVLDAAGNEARTNGTPVALTPACTDPHENNSTDDDALGQATPLGSTQLSERLCGGDEDWLKISVSSAATVKVLVHPAAALDPKIELTDSGGTPIGGVQDDPTPGADELLSRAVPSAGDYFVRVFSDGFNDGNYCVAATTDGNVPACGVGPGDVLITEVMADPGTTGIPDFVELYNRSGQAQDLSGMTVVYGAQQCTIQPVGGGGGPVNVADGARVWGGASGTGRDFQCAGLAVPSGGAQIELHDRNGNLIDATDLSGVVLHPGHSLETKPSAEDSATANDTKSGWCYTFFDAGSGTTNAADTRGGGNDGCNQFRVNESLWSVSGPDDGKAFVELIGNAPATASDNLLAGWRLVYVEGNGNDTDPSPDPGIVSTQGSIDAELVLPSGANPTVSGGASNGIYVVADSTAAGITQVANAAIKFPNADPENDLDSIQLLRPGVPATSNDCGAGLPGAPFLADVLGHSVVGGNLAVAHDAPRGCSLWEGQAFHDPGTGDKSVTRTAGADTNNNSADFSTIAAPGTPGQP